MSEPRLAGGSSATNEEWFSDWIASDFYQKMYSHRDSDEAEQCDDLILRATGFDRAVTGSGSPRRRALDLATGPGRHAIVLARRGFDVTAVDLSPTLLRHSQEEAEAAGVSIAFLLSDMRAIEFDHEF